MSQTFMKFTLTIAVAQSMCGKQVEACIWQFNVSTVFNEKQLQYNN